MWFQDRILAKIDKDVLNEVLGQWGVGPVSYFKPVSGWQNLGILVKVKEKDFLLRIFRPRKWAKEKIYLELELANHLKEKNLPAAQVFKTKEDKILAFRRMVGANLPIALMEFLPGVHRFDFSDKEIVISASLLGKLHLALEDFSSHHKAMRWYALPHLVLLKRKMKISRQEKGLVRFFNKDLGSMLKIFRKYKDKLLPKTLIHGDFHFANLLFSDSRISGVFDFDAARFATPLWDLAIFLGNVKIQFWEHQDKDFPIRRLEKSILDGYLGEAKLEKKEILLLPYLVRLFFWQKVFWAKREIAAGNLWAKTVFDWSLSALKEKF
jgi:Ser/Thr protein kinase RdoA (MazF antagonist)